MKKLALLILPCMIFLSCSDFFNFKTVTISAVYFDVQNVPSDYWSASSTSKPTLVLNCTICFDEDLVTADVEYARIYIMDVSGAGYWNIDLADFFDAGEKTIGGYTQFWWGDNSSELPIGNMKAVVMLKNKKSSERLFTVNPPGTTSGSATFVFSQDDQASASLPLISVPALRRPVVDSITNNGTTINVSFLVNDNRVNNGYVYFYDANKNYIGASGYFMSTSNGACTANLNGSLGFFLDGMQFNIYTAVNADIKAYGSVITSSAFNSITNCRVVLQDGAEYESSGHYNWYDYRSYSEYL